MVKQMDKSTHMSWIHNMSYSKRWDLKEAILGRSVQPAEVIQPAEVLRNWKPKMSGASLKRPMKQYLGGLNYAEMNPLKRRFLRMKSSF